MRSPWPGALSVLTLSFSVAPLVLAQATVNSGSVSGIISDPGGALVPGATVTLTNAVSGFTRTTSSGADGRYQFSNVPFNHYHLVIDAPGFAEATKDLELRSSIPVLASQQMALGAASTTVEVHADDLIENDPDVHTDLDASMIAKIPTGSSSSGLSSLLTLATPGVAADSNGLFHPQGEHADTSFSVDGQPISDQQSRNFSNQLSTSSIQSMEVINGVAPAEYGDKASMVVRTTTRSGLNSKLHGSLSGGYGTFGSSSGDGTLGYGSAKYGTFTAVDLLNSGRFLDSAEFSPIHDHGNVENLFERLDAQTSANDSAHVNLSFSRSWAQTPNQFDQQASGQDQRQEIKSFDIAPTYTHLFNATTLLSLNTWVRQDQLHYYPSGDVFKDTPATLADTRRLTSLGIKADLSHTLGSNTFKGGAVFQHTPLTEAFAIGITSPTYNAPCLDASGAPLAGSTLPCTAAGEQSNPSYVPGEAAFDLTRGGSTAHYGGTTDIKEEALYLEDSLTLHGFNASLGVRADNYNGISSRSMVEPRVGLGYRVQKTNTALRGSYGKFFLTPYNENLITSSATGLGGLANALGAFGQQALIPAKRNHFSAGLEQGLGKYIAVQADYFWKFTDRDYDFDIVLNTPLAFPIQWHKSKIDGYSARVNLTNVKGLTAYSVLGHTRSRFFGPEIGGIIFNDPNTPQSGAPFRIDHDQNFQQTTHFQYQPGHAGPWYSFNWSYESGLVAGAAPFAADTTTPVSLTYLSADQQNQIELTCGGQRATLSTPLTSCAPAALSSPLLRIPAPGTEDPDRNPARIAPRHLFDMALGWDNLLHGDRMKTNASLTVTNLTDKLALYNFLSTFSGTHFVAPRALEGQLTLVF